MALDSGALERVSRLLLRRINDPSRLFTKILPRRDSLTKNLTFTNFTKELACNITFLLCGSFVKAGNIIELI